MDPPAAATPARGPGPKHLRIGPESATGASPACQCQWARPGSDSELRPRLLCLSESRERQPGSVLPAGRGAPPGVPAAYKWAALWAEYL